MTGSGCANPFCACVPATYPYQLCARCYYSAEVVRVFRRLAAGRRPCGCSLDGPPCTCQLSPEQLALFRSLASRCVGCQCRVVSPGWLPASDVVYIACLSGAAALPDGSAAGYSSDELYISFVWPSGSGSQVNRAES